MDNSPASNFSSFQIRQLRSLCFDWLIRERWSTYNHLKMVAHEDEERSNEILDTNSNTTESWISYLMSKKLESQFVDELRTLLATSISLCHHQECYYDRVVSKETKHEAFLDEDENDIFARDYQMLEVLFDGNLQMEKVKVEVRKIRRKKKATEIRSNPVFYLGLAVQGLEETGLYHEEMVGEHSCLLTWLRSRSNHGMDQETMDMLLDSLEAIKMEKKQQLLAK